MKNKKNTVPMLLLFIVAALLISINNNIFIANHFVKVKETIVYEGTEIRELANNERIIYCEQGMHVEFHSYGDTVIYPCLTLIDGKCSGTGKRCYIEQMNWKTK